MLPLLYGCVPCGLHQLLHTYHRGIGARGVSVKECDTVVCKRLCSRLFLPALPQTAQGHTKAPALAAAAVPAVAATMLDQGRC